MNRTTTRDICTIWHQTGQGKIRIYFKVPHYLDLQLLVEPICWYHACVCLGSNLQQQPQNILYAAYLSLTGRNYVLLLHFSLQG